MKKVLSTIVAALVILSFTTVVFAADAPAPATPTSVEKKEATPTKECGKKCQKSKNCKKRRKCNCKPDCAKKIENKEETPVAPTAK